MSSRTVAADVQCCRRRPTSPSTTGSIPTTAVMESTWSSSSESAITTATVTGTVTEALAWPDVRGSMSSSVSTLTPDVPPQLKSVDDASSRHQAVETRERRGERVRCLNLILLQNNRLAQPKRLNRQQMHSFFLAARPFHGLRLGGRKDCKGNRVVEKECASRSFSW